MALLNMFFGLNYCNVQPPRPTQREFNPAQDQARSPGPLPPAQSDAIRMPKAPERCFKEIRGAFESSITTSSLATSAKLLYMFLFLDEVLHMSPLIPSVSAPLVAPVLGNLNR